MKTYKLGDICKIISGKDTKNKQGKIPLVSSSGILGFTSKFRVENSSISLPRVGTMKIFYYNFPVWNINTAFLIYETNKKIVNKKFLYFKLKSFNDWKKIIGNTTRPLTKISDWKKLRINLPSLEEQKKIIDIIESLEIKFKNIKENIKNLEKKLILLNNIKNILLVKYTKNLNNKIYKLKEIINLKFGKRITQLKNSGSKYPVYGGGESQFSTDFFNRENDLVVARFALSKTCVRFIKDKFWLLDSGFTFEINEKYNKKIIKKIVDFFLLINQNEIFNLAKGTGQKNLSSNDFLNLTINLPSLEEQKRIIKIIEILYKKIDFIENKIDFIIDNKKINLIKNSLYSIYFKN